MPTEQFWGALHAAYEVKVPAGAVEHAVAPVAVMSPYCPGGQAVQAVLPVALATDPKGQGGQTLVPDATEDVPMGHGRQTLSPVEPA